MLSIVAKAIVVETVREMRLEFILLLLLIAHPALNAFAAMLQLDPEVISQLHVIYE